MTRNRLLLMGLIALVVLVVSVHFGHALAGLAALGGLAFPVLGYAPQIDSDIVRQLTAWGILDACAGMKRVRVVAKTADYVIVSPVTTAGDASGTQFTNRGAAGAVNFTVPAAVQALIGVFYDFIGVAGQTITVTAAAGTAVTFNNAAATSLAMSTGGQKIGGHIRATCDGTSWILQGDTVGVTYTVA